MPKNRDRTMSPPFYDKHPPSLSPSSEGSDEISHTQKKISVTMLSQLFKDPSMTEEQKKMQSLEEKIEILGFLRIALFFFCVMLTLATMFSLWVPVKYLGIPFYSFILGFHSLSLAGLSILQYHFIPPLMDERSIISHNIEKKRPYLPAYYPSKKEMVWRYLRLSVAFISDAGVWIFLSYMELPDNQKDINDKEIIICFFLGSLLYPVSFLALFLLGPIAVDPKRMKYNTEEGEEGEEGEEDTDKKISLLVHNLSRELKAENFEEITKIRKEMLERDKIIMELSQDVKRLRRQRTAK